MKENNFEEFVKKQFEDFEIEPSKGLMEKILMARKSRKGAGLSFVGGKSLALLIVGLLLSGSWIFIKTQKSNKEVVQAQVHQPNTAQSDPEINSNSPSEDIKDDVQIPDFVVNSNHERVNENNSTNTSESIYNNKTIGSAGSNNVVFDNNKENKNVKNTAQKVKRNNINQEFTYIETEKQPEFKFSAQSDEMSIHEIHTIYHDKVLRQVSYITQISYKPLTHTFYPTLTKNNAFVATKDMLYTPNPIKRPRKGYSETKWFNQVEVNVGGGIWNDNAQVNNFSEYGRFSMGAKVLGRFKLSDKFNFITGFSFLHRTSNIQYSRTESQTYMSVDTTYGYIIDPGAPPVLVVKYDTSFNTLISYYKGLGRNVYNKLSLPLGVEYEIGFGQNLVYANGGLLLTLVTLDKGVWVQGATNELKTFSGRSNQISTAFNSGFFAGVGYGYLISPEFTWIVESNLSMWNFKNNPLGKSNKSVLLNTGLNTGLRWRF
ncbi:MAG: hypothetical protein M0R38_03185 [Bacteroidia bacterium]|nr:hypothetical protein [Bacteroidia bacterium]